MIEVSTKLSITQLAGPETGWTVGYLYKARMAGLPMEWDEDSRTFVNTPQQVERWLKKSKFTIVRGKPRVKNG